jgi:hypothetical protein
MSDSDDYTVDDLIRYLDTGLSLDTLREMDRTDLYRLREMLHHWEQMADRIYRERRAASKEEETE